MDSALLLSLASKTSRATRRDDQQVQRSFCSLSGWTISIWASPGNSERRNYTVDFQGSLPRLSNQRYRKGPFSLGASSHAAPCSIWRLCSESLGGQVNSCCWAPFCSNSGCNSEQELQETAYVLCCRSQLLASFLYSIHPRLISPAFVYLVIVKTGICLQKFPLGTSAITTG